MLKIRQQTKVAFKHRPKDCKERLKYKANAKQFVHNAEVDDIAATSIGLLEDENPKPRRANEVAKKALALIQKRQKLIKLADKGEAGWLVVDEYESDELAENSDDDM